MSAFTRRLQQSVTTKVDSFELGQTKPDATNTGLAVTGISPSSLTVHAGDWTISTPGTYDGYLIQGIVTITADNVTLRNCLIVGRTNPSYNGGAMIVSSGNNVLIENCELTAWDYTTDTDNTIYWLNGVKVTAGTATIKRCNIHDVVDGFRPNDGTAKIYGNYVHNLSYRSDDADQGSSATPPYGSHNDGVQVRGGNNHEIVGNNFVMNFSLNTGNPTYINPGWATGGDNALNLDPDWPDQNFGTVVWSSAAIIVQGPSGTVLTGVVVNENWISYSKQGIFFTSGTGAGSTASMSGNRITPNQEQQQMLIDATGMWTVTGVASTVYSDDPFVPEAWRGHALQAPYSSSGYTVYANPDWNPTPPPAGDQPLDLWVGPKQIQDYVDDYPEFAPLAAQPQGLWLTGSKWNPTNLSDYVSQADGKIVLAVLYAIPNRDSGGFSSGGFPDEASYLAWMQEMADAAGDARVWYILEPDALAMARNFSASDKALRLDMISQATTILKGGANARVYIDCGAWVDPSTTADLLVGANVAAADGVSHNVSNFQTTEDMITHGDAVVAQLEARGVPGKKYVIDTSRNGNGPLTSAFGPAATPWLTIHEEWCNPPGRGAGLCPRIPAGKPNCDAYLYIKGPGGSDGSDPGTNFQSDYFGENAPPSGTFWVKWLQDFMAHTDHANFTL